jgi:hypothetical protein
LEDLACLIKENRDINTPRSAVLLPFAQPDQARGHNTLNAIKDNPHCSFKVVLSFVGAFQFETRNIEECGLLTFRCLLWLGAVALLAHKVKIACANGNSGALQWYIVSVYRSNMDLLSSIQAFLDILFARSRKKNRQATSTKFVSWQLYPLTLK